MSRTYRMLPIWLPCWTMESCGILMFASADAHHACHNFSALHPLCPKCFATHGLKMKGCMLGGLGKSQFNILALSSWCFKKIRHRFFPV